ncbi:Hydrolase [Spraguea lophii 42_110]|uniref:Hydrolase n=1 Tax=Spraguea lophii (strain 42_110) TaxID=1358809 RepID=S7XGV6_SPRLO|nr:Hydrolase [Spraguea lophii 42_110]
MIKYFALLLPLILFYPFFGLPFVIFYYIVYFYNCRKPKIISSNDSLDRQFLEKRFFPFILGFNFVLQTLIDKFRFIKEKRNMFYLTNNDGGRFSVTVSENETLENIIIIHGFASSCDSTYVVNFEKKLKENNYRVFCMNMRGVQCELETPEFFHIGYTKDLKFLIEYIIENYQGNISLLGFSLGGSWITKFLGEYSDKNFMKRIKCGMAISSPLDFHHISKLETNLLHKLTINRIVANKLKQFILKYPIIYKHCNLSENDVQNLSITQDIDENITMKIFNYSTMEEYYIKNSAVTNMHLINKPVLIIISEDDMVSPLNKKILKACENNKNIILVITKRGGHIGFYGNDLSQSYIEGAVLDFLKYH